LNPPPVSPYGLIQETLWPDRWKILLSCMFLNCTSRKQVEKILPRFFDLWPTPKDLLASDRNVLVEVIKPLGFANRRAENIVKMSAAFSQGDWNDIKELPGIGEYAAAAYGIFCLGLLGSEPPKDGALVKYYNWRKFHEKREEARRSNQEGQV
jgi:methyl-CpG-binding domain protein 4